MNIEIANRLQKLRKEKGYSQESLADALGISRQAVSKWERAEASPDTDNLILLAKLYGVSLDELLSTEESQEEIVEDNKLKEEEKPSEESEHKPYVSVTAGGVYVDGGDSTVQVDHNGVKINGKRVSKKENKKAKAIEGAVAGINALLITAVYVFLGCFYNLWHPAWILFLLIPVIPSVASVILNKKLTNFSYPVLITAIYLFLGCQYDLWHPYWFLFVTIPLYYTIANPIDEYVFHSKDDEDDEDDDDDDVIDAD